MTNPTSEATKRSGSGAGAWLGGVCLTLAFYAILPFAPVSQDWVQRYFNAHWVEYASTGLFFIALSTLVSKAARLPREWSVLKSDPLDGLSLSSGLSGESVAARVQEHAKLTARHSRQTQLVRRIDDLCQFVSGRRSSDGLEGHLSYLAEMAATRLSDSYALIRTITWAIPILGFLGTVIGITMAIANITPDQLESSLNQVTGGLAVAFDTTALALALSMIVVFATYITERAEQAILDETEDYGIRRLLTIFPTSSGSASIGSPLLAAEAAAAAHLLGETESMVGRQTDLWRQSLEQLRDRWTGALSRQQDTLESSLKESLTQALKANAEMIETARRDFAATVRETGAELAEQLREAGGTVAVALNELSNRQQTQHEELSTRSSEVIESMTEATRNWLTDVARLETVLQDSAAQLHDQTGQLLKLAEQEGQLIRLEERLAENLQAVRAVDTLEETLLSLNAAVSVLSSKTRNKAA
ncbi:MAG: MotA/TolQ/ExbB proton channel family protein [Planctomycetaceae bacterium]|nr:MotA/TolQ/ExbB proton channel family protein [Planctomycetaceae bacterium]